MNMPQCIHPSFDGHLSSFLFASVVNNATRNILFIVFGLYVPDVLSDRNRIDNSP